MSWRKNRALALHVRRERRTTLGAIFGFLLSSNLAFTCGIGECRSLFLGDNELHDRSLVGGPIAA